MNAIEFTRAPIKTAWGDGMQVACVELDTDSTLTLYCHEDDLHKVYMSLQLALVDDGAQRARQVVRRERPVAP